MNMVFKITKNLFVHFYPCGPLKVMKNQHHRIRQLVVGSIILK